MKIAVIGCGLIGKKRAEAIKAHGEDEIVGCYDVNGDAANSFSSLYLCKSYASVEELLAQSMAESIVISVVNKFAKPYILQALSSKKHVLAEKPLGRNFEEANEILDFLASQSGTYLALKTGFNLRFHPAIQKAKSLVGSLGKIFYIRAQYGHGGRPGMESEWRSSKDLCGGGELLDQGVHIIDLCRWFSGDISSVSSVLRTYFWQTDVEDTAFVQMRSSEGVDIQFQVGWTIWKNTFNFELFGEKGYIRISGLGGSYGEETFEMGIRNPQGGAPMVQKEVFPNPEHCWLAEWIEYKSAIQMQRQPYASAKDGYEANRVVEAIYKSAQLNQAVVL